MKQGLISLVVVLLMFNCKQNSTLKDQPFKNTRLSGAVFGTTYSVLYSSPVNYTKAFDSLFKELNATLSTYTQDSDISRFNVATSVTANAHFKRVFLASKYIYKATQGVFDPTIGDVVNAWDFGAEHRKFLTDSTTIDSLMQFVGFDKVKLNGQTVEKPVETYLEFNAIAKGYAVDVIGDFLTSKEVDNYLVEIGGELRVKGKNQEKQSAWRVGLDKPRYDGEQSVYKVISLEDEAMATSGTYRKFKIDAQGHKYAHIINTATGFPSKTNILSVSVIADNCMVADGFATAFQAMGLERVKTFLVTHPELKAFLIFENEKQVLEGIAFNGFPED